MAAANRKGVKLKLGPLCVNEAALTHFKRHAERAHEMRTAAYLLAKHYLLVRLRRGETPPVDLRMLFRDVAASLGSKKPATNQPAPRPELRALLAADFPRGETDGAPFSVDTTGLCGNWVNYEADKYEAQVGTHVKANFAKCLFAFVEAELGLSRKQPLELPTIKAAVAALVDDGDALQQHGLNPLPDAFALPVRPPAPPIDGEDEAEALLLHDEEQLKEMALQAHVDEAPLLYLAPMLYMCARLEDRGRKAWAVLPLVTSHVPGHTFIDTAILSSTIPVALLNGRFKKDFADAAKTCGKRGKEARTADENRRLIDGQANLWRLVLRLDRMPRGGRLCFDNAIQTDGHACTVYLRARADQVAGKGRKFKRQQPKWLRVRDLPQALQDPAREVRVIGVDPGKNNLIFCLDDATPRYDAEHRRLIDRGRTFRYTKAQRNFETGHHHRRAAAEAYKARHCPQASLWEQRLRGHSARTLDVPRFIRFIEMFLASRAALRPFYAGRMVHRRDRLQAYRLQQKSEARLMARFRRTMQCWSRRARKRTVIAFGNGARSNLPGSAPGPSSRLHGLFLRHGFAVLDIQEAYTSKRCFHCKALHAENGPHRYHQRSLPGAPPDARPAQVWGVRRCCACDRPWSRDYHACLNIAAIARALLSGLPRPQHLCRRAAPADDANDHHPT